MTLLNVLPRFLEWPSAFCGSAHMNSKMSSSITTIKDSSIFVLWLIMAYPAITVADAGYITHKHVT